MWGLFGATLLLSIGALASPVVAFLLIPGAADAEDATVGTEAGEQESAAGEETQDSDSNLQADGFANAGGLAEDGDFEVQDDDDAVEMEVASSDDMDDFDDDDDFQSGDESEVDFEDFDDDEDFV